MRCRFLYLLIVLSAVSCARWTDGSLSKIEGAWSSALSGDYDAAVRELLSMERSVSRAPDSAKVRYYEVLEHVYENAYAYSQATDAAGKRLIYASSSNDTLAYGLALLDAAHLYLVQDSTEAAYGMLGAYEAWTGEAYAPLRGRYIQEKIDFICSTGAGLDSLDTMLGRYLEVESEPDWLAYASGCIHSGNWAAADSALTRYAMSPSPERGVPAEYYFLANQVDRAVGRVDSALVNMTRYAQRQEKDLQEALRSDVSHAGERSGRPSALLYIALVTLIVMLAGSWIVWHMLSRKRRARYESLRSEYLTIKQEYDRRLSSRPLPDPAMTSAQARETIRKRISSLAAMTGGSPAGNLGAAVKELLRISPDRGEFVETLALLFAIYSPSFYSALAEKGLSRYEIGYCCLFVLGYRTKELQDIVARKDVYNISSRIRSKFDLGPNDTNLSLYVNNLFSECGGTSPR